MEPTALIRFTAQQGLTNPNWKQDVTTGDWEESDHPLRAELASFNKKED